MFSIFNRWGVGREQGQDNGNGKPVDREHGASKQPDERRNLPVEIGEDMLGQSLVPVRPDFRAGGEESFQQERHARDLWSCDKKTLGTTPESIRVGLPRQLARSIGLELAENFAVESTVVDEACLLTWRTAFNDALSQPCWWKKQSAHLWEAVGVVCEARSYDHATVKLTEHMRESFQKAKQELKQAPNQEADAKTRISLAASLMREAVVRAFDDLFRGPTDLTDLGIPFSATSDGSMMTEFGVKGDVTKMSITMMDGHLALRVKEKLKQAQGKYREKIDQLERGEAIRKEDVFDLKLTIKLRESRQGYGPSEEVKKYKTTKEDLARSYLEALADYASLDYSKRMKDRMLKGIQAPNEVKPQNPQIEQGAPDNKS